MNQDQIEGRWTEMKGELRKNWAKLTDDDLEYIGGNRNRLVGRLQRRYGNSKEQAERDLDEWHHGLTEPATPVRQRDHGRVHGPADAIDPSGSCGLLWGTQLRTAA